jgi:hypothetical protein
MLAAALLHHHAAKLSRSVQCADERCARTAAERRQRIDGQLASPARANERATQIRLLTRNGNHDERPQRLDNSRRRRCRRLDEDCGLFQRARMSRARCVFVLS